MGLLARLRRWLARGDDAAQPPGKRPREDESSPRARDSPVGDAATGADLRAEIRRQLDALDAADADAEGDLEYDPDGGDTHDWYGEDEDGGEA